MELPDYIPSSEVQRVCRELGLRDWTALTEAVVMPEEAATLRNLLGGEALEISSEEFQAGLEVELEHGMTFQDANVTNNHPILTGLIVMAHFKESLDYYKLLDVAELEGDLVKAVAKGNVEKVKKYYKRLAAARIALSQAELKRIGK